MLLVGNDMDLIKEVKQQLSSKFDMKDIGPTHIILGITTTKHAINARFSTGI